MIFFFNCFVALAVGFICKTMLSYFVIKTFFNIHMFMPEKQWV